MTTIFQLYPSYDEDGNLTEDDRWEYEWDANNRLKKMSTRNAVLSFTTDVTYDFKYDYLGRRIEVKEMVSYWHGVGYC